MTKTPKPTSATCGGERDAMRLQRYILERILQLAIDAESAKPHKSVLLISDCQSALSALGKNENVQIVPTRDFVPPVTEQYGESTHAIRSGSPDYWATRIDVYPGDTFGRRLIDLANVASAEDLQKIKDAFPKRWSEFVKVGRALEEFVHGGSVTEYSSAVIVGETHREIRLKEMGRL